MNVYVKSGLASSTKNILYKMHMYLISIGFKHESCALNALNPSRCYTIKNVFLFLNFTKKIFFQL